MKKSLLAIAAMTAFASAAQAQSSVTIYGLYDGGFDSKQTEQTTSSSVKTQSSANGMSGGESASTRIGFKGVEQINGDISATFNLEYGFASSTGALTSDAASASLDGSTTNVRTAILGLSSKKFGSINIGRQTTGIHSIVAGNVWGGNNMVGDMVYSDFASTSAGAGATANGRVSYLATRASGMTSYTSPTIMGASIRADYANTTATSSGQPGNQIGYKGFSAKYTWGPITANAGTARIATNDTLASSVAFSGSVTTINAANISYSGIKNLLVQYTFATNKSESDAGVLASMVRAQKLSASYKIGQFMPFVQYGTGNTQGTRSSSAANTSTTDKAMQLGVEYSLSKRTNLYAAYGAQERKLDSTTAKTKITETAVGVRHTF